MDTWRCAARVALYCRYSVAHGCSKLSQNTHLRSSFVVCAHQNRHLLAEIEGILAGTEGDTGYAHQGMGRRPVHPAAPSEVSFVSRSSAEPDSQESNQPHRASRYPPNYDPAYLASLQTKPYRGSTMKHTGAAGGVRRKKKRSMVGGTGAKSDGARRTAAKTRSRDGRSGVTAVPARGARRTTHGLPTAK